MTTKNSVYLRIIRPISNTVLRELRFCLPNARHKNPELPDCQLGDQIKVPKWPFATFGYHSLLWSKAITSLRSQRGYSQPGATTVCCGQRPKHLKSHSSVKFW